VSAKLISIIGPPAVGKTTLAELLCEELAAELIREDYAGNPFLSEAYLGDNKAMLPSQLYFLLSRVKQLSLETWSQDGLFISDYGFCQDRIYANEKLISDDLGLYERVARRVGGLVKQPDVLINLDATIETLLERIAERGREFEKVFTAEFLSSMREDYKQIRQDLICPIIDIDSNKVDITNPSQLKSVAMRVRAYI